MQDHPNQSAFANEEEQLAALIRSAGRRPSPPREHYDEVLAGARAAWQDKVRSRRRVRIGYASAASIALLVCAGLLARYEFLVPAVPIATTQVVVGDLAVFSPTSGTWRPLVGAANEIKPGERLRTAVSSGTALRLATGVILRLDENSEVVLERADRLTLASGGMYIDSGDDGLASSVTIRTPFGAVRDIGTQFEVRMSSTQLQLRVRRGIVELTRTNYSATELTRGGQQLALSSTGTLNRGSISPSDPAWQWAQRLARPPVGDDRSVSAYLEWVAAEQGRTLRYDSRNTQLLAELNNFEGDPSQLGPAELLAVIELASGFAYQMIDEDILYISRE